MAKRVKKKKGKAPTTDTSTVEDDDSINLQSIISALKEKPEEPEAEPAPVEVEEEGSFELIEDVEEDAVEVIPKEKDEDIAAPRVSPSPRKDDDLRKAREALEADKRAFEERKSRMEAELKTVGADLVKKKEQILKIEEQLRQTKGKQTEKERDIKKATELLLGQRQSLADKERKMESLKEELQRKAEELKKKEENLSTFKDRTAELDAREIRIRELEDKLKDRELHLKSIEKEMSDCPRCGVKDRYLSVETMITELKEYGIVDDSADRDLAEVRRLIDGGNTDRAVQMAEDLIKRLKDLKEDVLVKGIKYLLLGAERNLRHAKEVGGHSDRIEDAERWLNDARQFIDKEEYKTAEFYIKEADFLMQSIEKGVETSVAQPATGAEGPSRNYNCPSCYTTFTVDTNERPVRITCPGCQIELIIKEDVNFA